MTLCTHCGRHLDDLAPEERGYGPACGPCGDHVDATQRGVEQDLGGPTRWPSEDEA